MSEGKIFWLDICYKGNILSTNSLLQMWTQSTLYKIVRYYNNKQKEFYTQINKSGNSNKYAKHTK